MSNTPALEVARRYHETWNAKNADALNAGEIEPNLVAHHWTGTFTVPGPDGSKTTGRVISFKGASIVQVDGDKIVSDHVYYDRKLIDTQVAGS
jgi:hypothetical protein